MARLEVGLNVSVRLSVVNIMYNCRMIINKEFGTENEYCINHKPDSKIL